MYISSISGKTSIYVKSTVEDPFTNSAAHDYSLKTSSEAEGAGFDNGVTGNMDIGAIQKAGGGGGGLASSIMGNLIVR